MLVELSRSMHEDIPQLRLVLTWQEVNMLGFGQYLTETIHPSLLDGRGLRVLVGMMGPAEEQDSALD